MSDVAIVWDGISADIAFTTVDLKADDGLYTAVLISLFTDRKVGSERGFWGDSFEDSPMGSRLWLLSREKIKDNVALRANEYALEALAWMKKSGVAKSIFVDSYIEGKKLLIPIKIVRPDGEDHSFKFSANWGALT